MAYGKNILVWLVGGALLFVAVFYFADSGNRKLEEQLLAPGPRGSAAPETKGEPIKRVSRAEALEKADAAVRQIIEQILMAEPDKFEDAGIKIKGGSDQYVDIITQINGSGMTRWELMRIFGSQKVRPVIFILNNFDKWKELPRHKEEDKGEMSFVEEKEPLQVTGEITEGPR
ncbi:MAG: hypothetical protein PHH49_07265 [Candidatus Omnitrophica bacterium]|nr:hypothetical protein [Candidatus Omnitrophota bacterium]MDD5488733.1 hypothetical protein [Candidatus Omnitrophota bacterium]